MELQPWERGEGEGGGRWVDVCAYQDMLTRIFERVHPACFVQHPLFPLSHKAYVLLKPNQSVPPACQCANPYQSTHILYIYMHTSKGPVLPIWLMGEQRLAQLQINKSKRSVQQHALLATTLPKALHVSLLNIAVSCDVMQRMQVVSHSRLMTASIPRS